MKICPRSALLAGAAACSSAPAPRIGIGAEMLKALSMDEVVGDAHAAGVPCGDRLAMAGAIAMAESNLVPDAQHYNPPDSSCPNGSLDRGLWQINDCYHSEVSDACAYDPACNARGMAAISGGGANWEPWTTFQLGMYVPYLDDARAAAERVCSGFGGGSGGGCPYGDGQYCGGNGVSGDASTLYRCSGGSLTVAATCAASCRKMPAGEDDACAPCPYGDGLYCGGNGIGGDASTLYRCSGGARTVAERCARGCAKMPVNVDDRCD